MKYLQQYFPTMTWSTKEKERGNLLWILFWGNPIQKLWRATIGRLTIRPGFKAMSRGPGRLVEMSRFFVCL